MLNGNVLHVIIHIRTQWKLSNSTAARDLWNKLVSSQMSNAPVSMLLAVLYVLWLEDVPTKFIQELREQYNVVVTPSEVSQFMTTLHGTNVRDSSRRVNGPPKTSSWIVDLIRTRNGAQETALCTVHHRADVCCRCCPTVITGCAGDM